MHQQEVQQEHHQQQQEQELEQPSAVDINSRWLFQPMQESAIDDLRRQLDKIAERPSVKFVFLEAFSGSANMASAAAFEMSDKTVTNSTRLRGTCKCKKNLLN